jgi:L-rhamnose mutarotase
MSRFAFKMFLKPGFEAEYEKRHAAIWPELVKMIKDSGVGNYSIYWDRDTNILFGYQECFGEGNSQDTSNGIDPITQKWWDMMADIMEVNPEDNSPVTIPLKEVFHLD